MKITENAHKQFQLDLNKRNKPGSGIRIFTSGSCCFPTLEMDIVDKACAGDKIITVDDLDFFFGGEAKEIRGKLTIDYTEGNYKFGIAR